MNDNNSQFTMACEKLASIKINAREEEITDYDYSKTYNLALDMFKMFDSHYVTYIQDDYKLDDNKPESMYEIPRRMASIVAQTKSAYELNVLKDFEPRFMEYCFNDYAFEQGLINAEEHNNHEHLMIKNTKDLAQDYLDKKGDSNEEYNRIYGYVLGSKFHDIYKYNSSHAICLFNSYLKDVRGNTNLSIKSKMTIIGSSGDILNDVDDYIDKYEEEQIHEKC